MTNVSVSVSVFTCYARRNRTLVVELGDRLGDHFAASRRHSYDVWRDERSILIGQGWDDEIMTALLGCRFGIVMLSPAALASGYIKAVELPALIRAAKALPVMIQPIDFELHDLQGLDACQVFTHEGRAYNECKADAERDAFALALFQQIEQRLARGT